MAKVLVTGASGFIGRNLCSHLREAGHTVRAAVRSGAANADTVVVGDLAGKPDWGSALHGIEVVVHLAALVHAPKEDLEAFRKINVEGTLRLAREAVAARVPRFIFLSSIAVNGERTTGKPFTEADPPAPVSPYGVSKWEAEQQLDELVRETGLGLTIVRPPMVYGPDAPGNFRSLVGLVRSGLPLPFGRIRNRRSFIGIENLCSVLGACVENAAAAGQVFCVADGEDVSTPELVRYIASGLSQPLRIFEVPLSLLEMGGQLAGQKRRVSALCDSLQIDGSRTRSVLGWQPPRSFASGVIVALTREGDDKQSF